MMTTNGDGRKHNSPSVAEVLVTEEDGGDTSSVPGGSDDGSGVHSTSSPNSNSGGSTGTGKSGTNHSGTGSVNGNSDNVFRRDGGALSGARCCFLLTLLVAACALATVVSLVTTNDQTEDFSASFEDSASAVIEGSNKNVLKVFEALEGLSTTTTTFIKQQAVVNEGKYPPGYVTIPDSEYIMGNAREASKALFLTYTPYVASGEQDYSLWAEYAQEHQYWVAQAYAVNPGGGDPVQGPVGTTDATAATTAAPGGSINTTGSTTTDGDGATRRHLADDDATFFPTIWKLNRYNEDGDYIPGVLEGSDGEIVLSCTELAEMEAANPTVKVEKGPESPDNGPFAPVWQVSPPPNPSLPSSINFNMESDMSFRHATHIMADARASTFLDICPSSSNGWFDDLDHADEIYTMATTPAFADYSDTAPIVGAFMAVVSFRSFLEGILVDENLPVYVVMSNECRGQAFTYEISGPNVTLIDCCGDAHTNSTEFSNMAVTAPFAPFTYEIHDGADGHFEADHCEAHYNITVYPTTEYQQAYTNSDPLIYTLTVLAIFLFTTMAFLAFDCLVQQRQRTLITTAIRQNAIVSSLFPKSIQKKLMEDMDAEATKNKSGKAGLRTYLNDTNQNRDFSRSEGSDGLSVDGPRSKPIADLFPETTVMFADIAGFTAWSSTREPSQVFTLLEAIYHEFDMIAKRRRVFKVEVVGDCYVAVCGLPDPRRDHAVVMAKFANECLNRMFHMTRVLEVELGPETTELGLRVGMHSGPVVAGVLRGDKSRFQLFGDTMNTASRMESTGTPNRIQVSQETADLIKKGGKKDWLSARETKVEAKGKGELQTYWVSPPDTSRSSDHGTVCSTSDDELDKDDRFGGEIMPDPLELEAKRNRVAEWTVEVLASVLKVIVIARKSQDMKAEPRSKIEALEREILSNHDGGQTVIDEVAEVIVLPDYNAKKYRENPDVTLDPIVMSELRNYVQTIATLYNNNEFHNFDHANHVVMSVNKLLSRIVAPDLDDATGKDLHDHTYGITSDPLTWFAVVFSALIHDVDHTGVPNAQLVKEGAPVAALYFDKSVAEQNSVDMSWDLLMEPSYSNLRYTIYTTTAEFKRFRQLVVNSVMATDIVDKEMKTMRNDRWANAFDPKMHNSSPGMVRTMKSTIVIEHLIQASDVAHTMQHWHIYRRWNEKFFKECYAAYKDGRAERNPADTWYEGEKGFFDFYIIPLAKKLKECGVFGVSSDEYLSYATQNRQEWEERGEEVVKEMVRSVTKRDRRSSGDGRKG